jgi:hypothetical protein
MHSVTEENYDGILAQQKTYAVSRSEINARVGEAAHAIGFYCSGGGPSAIDHEGGSSHKIGCVAREKNDRPHDVG